MSMVLGITGIIGTGKSQVARYLAEKYNFQIINVDQVGHELLAENSVVSAKVLRKFGTVKRKQLAEIVFHDHDKLQELNRIMHPEMFKLVEAKITVLKNQNIAIEAALLYQIGLDKFCDKIICLKSSIDTIFGRLIEKGLNKKQINERLASAPEIIDIQNIFIENDQSLEELFFKIDAVLEKIQL